MYEVRTVTVRATATQAKRIIATLADGDSRPLGGPREEYEWNPRLNATDNHWSAAVAFVVQHYSTDALRTHAEDPRHLGFGSYRFTVTDYSADSDEQHPDAKPALIRADDMNVADGDVTSVPTDLLRNIRVDLLLASQDAAEAGYPELSSRLLSDHARLLRFVPYSPAD